MKKLLLMLLLCVGPAWAGDGIVEMKLEALASPNQPSQTVVMKAGSFKAFDSDPADAWLLVPQAEAKADSVLADTAAEKTLVFGMDVASGQFGKFKVPDGKTAYIVAANPGGAGRWLLVRQRVDGNKIKLLGQVFLVVGDDAPQPDVNPNPPGPPPKPKALFVVVVREKSQVTPERALVMGDPLWQQIVKAGGSFRDYDAQQDIVKKNKYDVAMREAGLSEAVFVFDKDTSKQLGKPVAIPATPADLKKLLEGFSK